MPLRPTGEGRALSVGLLFGKGPRTGLASGSRVEEEEEEEEGSYFILSATLSHLITFRTIYTVVR